MQLNLNQVQHCMMMASNASNKLLVISWTTHLQSITNSLWPFVKLVCSKQPPPNAQITSSHNYLVMLPPIPTTVFSIGPVILSLLPVRTHHISMSARHVSVSEPTLLSQKITHFLATISLSLPLHKLSGMPCPHPPKLNSTDYSSQPKI